MIAIEHLADIAGRYDAFIIDVWGVLHDGVATYPDAVACLKALRGRNTLLLSNAPRRAASAIGLLRKLGVPDELHGGLLTSGEAAFTALRDRQDPWFQRLGSRLYHLGPKRDRSVFEDLPLTVAAAPDQADFVLNTGPDDDASDPRDLAFFIPELESCLAARLPMICANPDKVVIRGGVRILCAGALAEYYRTRGGDVFSLGKPDPAIYRLALQRLGTEPSKTLAIGDSLHTDIAGASGVGMDSLWILGGIHGEAIAGDLAHARVLAAEESLDPTFAANVLTW
jgi:HAD superfamily hydrolase (TIGR01459 family)